MQAHILRYHERGGLFNRLPSRATMSQATAEQGDADVVPSFLLTKYVEGELDCVCLPRVPRQARALGSAMNLLQAIY